MSKRIAVGIDLGGTNIKIGLVDQGGRLLDGHRPTCRRTKPIPTPSAPEAGLDVMVEMVLKLLELNHVDRRDVVGVGLGSPGPLSRSKGVLYRLANLPKWQSVPIVRQLSEKLALPVILENDGNAAALGEHWVGAGKEDGDLVMLTLGTGIGGGVILGGQLLRGHLENAAEIGHMIVQPAGLECACGQRGCLERYASASALARLVEQSIRDGKTSSLTEHVKQGQALDGQTVATAARQGDALCRHVWQRACDYLAIACVNIEHLYNPARIVLGGGLAHAGEQLLDPVSRAFAAQRWTLQEDRPEIVLAQLGNDAGLIGAARLAHLEAR